MKPDWFKPRTYRHFDVPVSPRFAEKSTKLGFAARHSFSPHISYLKKEKRFRLIDSKQPHLGRKLIIKTREIMYASHRDACILSYYSSQISKVLNNFYTRSGLGKYVIAYRALGKANYHFSSEAFSYAKYNAPCTIIAYDVTGFFDNIDHSILKQKLKYILDVKELSPDWYAIFRQVTKFKKILLSDLKAHPIFGARIKNKVGRHIATVAEIKAAGIVIGRNNNLYGILQGTPISSTFANLYMIDVDRTIASACEQFGAFYRRYSDDILIICKPSNAVQIESIVLDAIDQAKLTINSNKIERNLFDLTSDRSAQYLGFSLHPNGAAIRASSLSRQWRKLRQAAKMTEKAGNEAIAAGRATKIYTRKLRRRFSPLPLRNFSSYARR